MLLRAFAKINLDLRVLGPRDDGYHEVRTELQVIDWYDEILIEPSGKFEFSATEGPQDETNLVVRAVRAYEDLTGVKAGIRIRLTKNVPIGRGLGGGSADAAATFIGLQRIFKRTLPEPGVFRALRDLGSDVPFFTIGGRALGVGRGDEVAPIEDDKPYWLVVVDPGIFIPTAEAYSWLTLSRKSNSIEGFRAQSAFGCETELENQFEVPVFGRYPVLGEIKNELRKLGAFRAALSGTGSAVFGQFHTESQAMQAAAALDGRHRVKLTKPLPGHEYFQRMVEE